MLFIAVTAFVVVTLVVLYLTKRVFDNFKIEKLTAPFRLNIMSDKIIILSRDGCPWCEKLDPYLEVSKNEYVKINVNNDNTFKFDEKFSKLEQGERETIIKGAKDLLENVGHYFPTIIYENEYIIGFPEEPILNKLFN